MKWVLVLFLCFNCLAWDDVEETKTETKGDSKAWTTSDYVEHIYGNTQYIKYSLFPYDDTFTHESLYEMIGQIRTNVAERDFNLKALYDGYEELPNLETKSNTDDLGNFRNFYTGVTNLNNIGLNELPDPNVQSYAYMQYIKNFSVTLYQDYTPNYNLPDNYLSYPDKFSFVEPIARALDEETTDFQPDTLKNVLGMQKINSVNTFVDEILTDITKNPNESNFDSDFLVGGSNFADTTFHIDLTSLGELWMTLANKYGGGSGSSSPSAKGSVITTNPFRNWVFDFRLRPQQGDYLYSIYTWWNSDQPLPRAIRYTLQALVYAYTFYYCFTYTKELWSK